MIGGVSQAVMVITIWRNFSGFGIVAEMIPPMQLHFFMQGKTCSAVKIMSADLKQRLRS